MGVQPARPWFNGRASQMKDCCDAGVLGDGSAVQEALRRGPTRHVHPIRVAQPAPGPHRAHSPGAAGGQAKNLPTHATRVLIISALGFIMLNTNGHSLLRIAKNLYFGMSRIRVHVRDSMLLWCNACGRDNAGRWCPKMSDCK